MSDAQGFDTPEQAAMFGFPEKYCRVIASSVDDDWAYVLLDTGSDGRSYFYGGWCRRQNGRWYDAGSSNGSSLTLRSHDPDVGMMAFWDEVPAGVEAVRVEFFGDIQEVKVKDGAFLAMWWRTPASGYPRIDAFRIDGEWIRNGQRKLI
jgi:hypothetical protein